MTSPLSTETQSMPSDATETRIAEIERYTFNGDNAFATSPDDLRWLLDQLRASRKDAKRWQTIRPAMVVKEWEAIGVSFLTVYDFKVAPLKRLGATVEEIVDAAGRDAIDEEYGT